MDSTNSVLSQRLFLFPFPPLTLFSHYLNNNKITTISSGAFSDLASVVHLHVFINLSISFFYYHNLNSNVISALSSGSFNGLSKLVSLFFHYFHSIFIVQSFLHWSQQPEISQYSGWSIHWTQQHQISLNLFFFLSPFHFVFNLS